MAMPAGKVFTLGRARHFRCILHPLPSSCSEWEGRARGEWVKQGEEGMQARDEVIV